MGVVSLIDPLGEIRVVIPGGVTTGILKVISALHGPCPVGLQVWTHQVKLPEASVIGGVTAQVPPLQIALV